MMQNPVNRQTFNLFYIPSVEGEQMLEDSSTIHKEKKNIGVTKKYYNHIMTNQNLLLEVDNLPRKKTQVMKQEC